MPALRTRDTPARSLEVTTDAPQPPMLAIISPTPRAFTFPSSHNLNDCDSPYSTPSSSPFEPDLRSLALSSTSSSSSCITPPPLMRTLTPDSASPASVSHKRRKSGSSITLTSSPSDVERRPKKGDEDYIKRPENAFILFRRKCVEEREATAAAGGDKKQRQADLSKAISQQWKSLPAEERKYWEQLAKEKKKEHEQMYPNYVYRPQRVKDKDGKVRNKKRVKKISEDDESQTRTVSFVIPPPVNNARLHGRSASAPTPPPSFTTIQLPSLFSSNASCPSSPSLLPMISRRAAHSGNPEDLMQNFDYRPSGGDHLLPPAEFQQLHISHQIVDQSMFSPSTTCSSGPSSPASGPFTPSSPYSQQSAFPTSFSLSSNVDEIPYWEWPSSDVSTSASLMNGDFDISSIPPIELGVPKDHHHLDSQYMDMESFSPVYDYDNSQSQHQWTSDDADFTQFSLDLDPSSLLQVNGDGVDGLQMHLLPSHTELEAHSTPTF